MLMTAEEVSKELRVSVGQVYRLARTKRIPAHHLGNAVRFNLADVLAATSTQETVTLRVLPPSIRRQFATARLQHRARTPRRTS